MVFYGYKATAADMESKLIDFSALLYVDMYTFNRFLAPVDLDFFSNFVRNAKIHNITSLLAAAIGFEPMNAGVKVPCLSSWLCRKKY